MEKLSLARWLTMVVWFIFFFSVTAASSGREILPNEYCSSPGVRLYWKNHHRHRMVIDNGLVQVTLSNPKGDITEIQYNEIGNVLEIHNGESNRGYWDVVWNKPGTRVAYDRLKGTNFRVIMEDENQVEVSFTRTWNASIGNYTAPLNVDKRYILRRGSSGIYMYTILERLEGWPDFDMDQIRIVCKLRSDKFQLMAVSDDKHRIMPAPKDCRRGQRLAYPEAVLLTDPANPKLKGEVDDKYQYSCENKDNRVHGWISQDPPVGFWMITPSDEFRAGGPIKQDLTSHVGPTVLNMFTSTHYTGKDLNTQYRNGKPWKKVFGPVYAFLNSISTDEDPMLLWEDAKEQMLIEVESWPYDFPQSEDFPSSRQRGSVSGQLLIHDRYNNKRLMWAGSAHVGLAAPGDVGSWQRDSQGYQFWTRANKEGYFLIENVRAGEYNLYAWVPGIIGDWKFDVNISVQSGYEMELGVLVYEPPRNGPTLWEIGIPDRTAAEFFVPDTYPTLENKLYANHPTDKFRQYGLWERYTDMYPTQDLIYTIGISNYCQDWFFAQVPRKTGNNTFQATTWQIKYDLENVNRTGSYALQVALASASAAELQVRFNDPSKRRPHFSTRLIGRDNAIARHGIHGLYWLYSINVPSYLLRERNNTIYLTQSRSKGPFCGIMYDYIRFEGPSQSNT
ncbi:rhamnogalacturonate lyase B-like isoform X1 [Hevea brasiliensis]|uniref:rhamnogalacturonate lyase B-like isoform X1 n=1 Tax=Hevea brasiliensis TaxID=3981 RepID=UPI0025D9A17B|nr:rhamnogalacturonate lyase B-like isoform X1 [Hevea brasiliensis]